MCLRKFSNFFLLLSVDLKKGYMRNRVNSHGISKFMKMKATQEKTSKDLGNV